MEQQKIGQLLKELRKGKGLTQAQLAEQFGVSDRSVSRWETGVTLPDLSVLVELADFYEIDIRELIDGERKQAEEKKASYMGQGKEQAFYYHDKVVQAMDALRKPADELEKLVDKEYWPFPTYGDLLFGVR